MKRLACVTKHPVNAGNGASPTTAKYKPESQEWEADYLHVMDLRKMLRRAKFELQTQVYRIGRITARRPFLFHTAHARSVRITDRYQLDKTLSKG